MIRKTICSLGGLSLWWAWHGAIALAQPLLTPTPEPTGIVGESFGDFFRQAFLGCTLDQGLLAGLEDPAALADQGIGSAGWVSQTEMSQPSLWWAREQLFGQRPAVVENWLVLPEQQRVELIVNRAQWAQLDSLEQYRIVNHFGQTAQRAGYQLRVFNGAAQCVALYTCSPEAEAVNRCTIDLEPSRRDPFGFVSFSQKMP